MGNPVKIMRELLNDPAWRGACGIPEGSEIDESALDELEAWCDEPICDLSDIKIAEGPYVVSSIAVPSTRVEGVRDGSHVFLSGRIYEVQARMEMDDRADVVLFLSPSS